MRGFSLDNLIRDAARKSAEEALERLQRKEEEEKRLGPFLDKYGKGTIRIPQKGRRVSEKESRILFHLKKQIESASASLKLESMRDPDYESWGLKNSAEALIKEMGYTYRYEDYRGFSYMYFMEEGERVSIGDEKFYEDRYNHILEKVHGEVI